MTQKNLDEKQKETILEGLGFTEKNGTPGLFQKSDDVQMMNWDFRTTNNGKFYVSIFGKGYMDLSEAKKLPEYTTLRNAIPNESNGKGTKTNTPKMNTVTKIPPKNNDNGHNGELIELRGNEQDITTVVKQRNLDLIIKASKDPNKPGEGILYYDKKIGSFQLTEPSVELVDLITQQMGNITVEIVEKGINKHIDDASGKEYQTYYCVVKAKDTLTGTEGLGSAEEIIDYNEMNKQGRTFALTKALRKAERNAKERLIPVPRKAMVELVKEMIKQYQQGNGGN